MIKLFIILMFFSVHLFAAEEHEKNYVPMGCVQDTDMATVHYLSDVADGIPDTATHILWQATGDAFRWIDDTSVSFTSATTNGMLQPIGSEYTFFYSGVLGKVRLVEESTSTVFTACYYK